MVYQHVQDIKGNRKPAEINKELRYKKEMCKRWKLGQLIWGRKRYVLLCSNRVGKAKVYLDLNLGSKIL